jgi:hypothetical protein
LRNCRCFARVHALDQLNREVWFSSSAPRGLPDSIGGSSSGGDNKPPDERTLQLGKSRLIYFFYNLTPHTDRIQPSRYSTRICQRFYKHRSRRKRSHLASVSISSLQPIHTCRPCLAG